MSENKELTLMITIVIIVCLFAVQSRGTERIGRTFGTVVMIWFSFLAVVGLVNLSSDWSVLEALNPVRLRIIYLIIAAFAAIIK